METPSQTTPFSQNPKLGLVSSNFTMSSQSSTNVSPTTLFRKTPIERAPERVIDVVTSDQKEDRYEARKEVN